MKNVLLALALLLALPAFGDSIPDSTGRPSSMEKEDVYIFVEEMPAFQGKEWHTFNTWVIKNLNLPEEWTPDGSKVIVSFVVEPDGSVSNVTILRATDKVLAAEVVRVISRSPRWTPGCQRQMPVRVKLTFPVHIDPNLP